LGNIHYPFVFISVGRTSKTRGAYIDAFKKDQEREETSTMAGNTLMINNNPGEKWLYSRPGERFLIRVPAAATNGSYSVTEIVASPGDSTPVHLHEKEEEHFLIVEGTVRFLYGDETFDATAGTMVSCDRGIPHAWGNATDAPIRMMVTASPGGCEEALRMIAEGGEQVDVMAIAKKFSIRVIGPPMLGK
jgi:quercetin dioxygenase-like cupin family protein